MQKGTPKWQRGKRRQGKKSSVHRRIFYLQWLEKIDAIHLYFWYLPCVFVFRLETLRKHARRRLGLDLIEPSNPNLDADEYAVAVPTTAQKSTVSSLARTKATEVEKSKVNFIYIDCHYLFLFMFLLSSCFLIIKCNKTTYKKLPSL